MDGCESFFLDLCMLLLHWGERTLRAVTWLPLNSRRISGDGRLKQRCAKPIFRGINMEEHGHRLSKTWRLWDQLSCLLESPITVCWSPHRNFFLMWEISERMDHFPEAKAKLGEVCNHTREATCGRLRHIEDSWYHIITQSEIFRCEHTWTWLCSQIQLTSSSTEWSRSLVAGAGDSPVLLAAASCSRTTMFEIQGVGPLIQIPFTAFLCLQSPWQ